MKAALCVLLLATAVVCAEEKKTEKRGVLGLGYGYSAGLAAPALSHGYYGHGYYGHGLGLYGGGLYGGGLYGHGLYGHGLPLTSPVLGHGVYSGAPLLGLGHGYLH